ncbi:hypothetical protein TNCV_3589001 [Trichonephila clavipes]|nr:hypothetical protein TNCV_3589001 [Trichonephila clavipes]
MTPSLGAPHSLRNTVVQQIFVSDAAKWSAKTRGTIVLLRAAKARKRSLAGVVNRAGLNYHSVSSEEFVAVGDAVGTAPIMADKGILEFLQSSKNIIDADSDDEKEMNNAAPVPTSSEMRNVMKNMFSYLDAHSKNEMNNKMDDIEQFVDNLIC